MRVIAGKLKGLPIISPLSSKTHPMSEKIRGALFNALGNLDGLSVLDGFSGSGALAIEAVSRAADNVLAIDSDPKAVNAIKQNISNLKLASHVRVVKVNIKTWSQNNRTAKFDLVIIDPPFEMADSIELNYLTTHLEPQGLIILSWPIKLNLPVLPGTTLIKILKFGDAQLAFYKLNDNLSVK